MEKGIWQLREGLWLKKRDLALLRFDETGGSFFKREAAFDDIVILSCQRFFSEVMIEQRFQASVFPALQGG